MPLWKDIIYRESTDMISDKVLFTLSELEVKCMIYRLILAEIQINLPISISHTRIEKHSIKLFVDGSRELQYGPYNYYYAVLARWSELHKDSSIELDVEFLTRYDELPVQNYTSIQCKVMFDYMFTAPVKFSAKQVIKEISKWKTMERT